MRQVVSDAAALVASAVGGAWTVYEHAVPDGPSYPYVWLYANTGQAGSVDLANTPTLRDVTLWVSATAAGTPQQAASQAAWGAEKAQAALVGSRPYGWRPQHLASAPPARDDDLPDRTVFYAVDTYGITLQV